MQAAGIHTGLNYQERPPSGRRTGRNIGEHANMAHDLQDVHVLTDIDIGDARGIAAKLDKEGFELRAATSGCEDFQNETAIANFYAATSDVVKACSGADRVAVFDHTLRKSGVSDLNSLDGKSAAGAVVRVHCDYTPSSGPVRLAALAEGGQVDLPKAPSRFAFINVWRNIDREHPVLTNPLAVCAADSVDLSDAWPYLMMYETRTGENYAIDNSNSHQHRWFYYPQMKWDEALVFKVYDSREDGPRFVFHTAFNDPTTPADAPPRQSVEVRTIAMWD